MNRTRIAISPIGRRFAVVAPFADRIPRARVAIVAKFFVAMASLLAARSDVTAAPLFVSDENSSTLEKISSTGTVSTFAGGIFSGGGPYDLAIDRNGNLLVANGNIGSTFGTIYRYTPAGSRSIFFSANGASFIPVSLAFDANGRLFVGDTLDNNIRIVTTGGALLPFASGLVPERLAFDTNGNLFVADISGVIYKFTSSGSRSVFATGSDNRAGLAFDSHGNLFASDYGGGAIDEYTPSGVQTRFAIGVSFPDGLAFDSSGTLFEADAGSGHIYKFSPTGVRSTFVSGLQGPTFLAFAVPEPSALLMLAIGGLALIGAAVRSSRRRIGTSVATLGMTPDTNGAASPAIGAPTLP